MTLDRDQRWRLSEKNILLCSSSIVLAENQHLVSISTFTGPVLMTPCLMQGGVVTPQRTLLFEVNLLLSLTALAATAHLLHSTG